MINKNLFRLTRKTDTQLCERVNSVKFVNSIEVKEIR